jgi:hypothetical protein
VPTGETDVGGAREDDGGDGDDSERQDAGGAYVGLARRHTASAMTEPEPEPAFH